MRKLLLLITLVVLSISAHAQGGIWSGGSVVGGTNLKGAISPVAAPSPANTTILQALNNAANVPVHIVVMGDSFNICDQTNCGVGPTVSTNRWPEQLRIKLQAIYGSHGTGIVPIAAAFNGTTPTLNNEAWSCSGQTTIQVLGPYMASQGAGTLVELPAGASCTFHDNRNIAWDTLNTYCVQSASSSDLQVTIDGGPVLHACATNATQLARLYSFSTTNSTSHTVVFSSPSGFSFLYAAEGQSGSSGVSIDNVAIGGAQAEAFGIPANNDVFTDLIPGGTQAVLYMLQTNDSAFGVATGTFSTYISNLVSHEQALSSAPSVMLVIPPVDVINGTHAMAPYTNTQLGLCSSLNIPCVNIQNRGTTVGATPVGWGTTYNASSGLWDLAGTAWPGGNAGVHPNDKGNLDMFQIVYGALLNPQPSAVGPLAAPTGVCPTAGQWVFSQDGHATFCPSAGGTWATKI